MQENYQDHLTFAADAHSLAMKGFQEVVFSVRDIEANVQMYQDIAGWKMVYKGELSRKQLDAWKLDKKCKGQEALLINPGTQQGFLRLVAFEGVHQEHIRAHSQSWDTGGIYDIDIRTTDMDVAIENLQKYGYMGFSKEKTYHFGEYHVSEILAKGGEDIVLALMKRHNPPLEGYPHLRKWSRIFNSSQIVKDIAVTRQFYEDVLGFQEFGNYFLEGSDSGNNLFGIPGNVYKNQIRKICILHPEKTNFGSVELVELTGLEGRDFSEKAHPPNLGILMLRFPVKSINAWRKRLEEKSVNILGDVEDVDIAPYGKCKLLSIQSPDGAWLEFVELSNG